MTEETLPPAGPMDAPEAAPSVEAPPADEAPPSDAFREALESFERVPGATAHDADVAAGTRVKATVVSVGDEQVLVDIGGRSEGVVEARLLRDDSGAVKVGVGDVLDLFVVEAGDQVTLAPSLKAERGAALRQMREAREAGVPVSGKVTAQNAGGLAVDLAGVRGFCPVSQIELGFCADPSVYVGRTLEFLVTEVDSGRKNVVLSRKALLRRAEEALGKQMLETLKPGDDLDGTVARLEPFGAFVDLGGLDGMVHVSEIRWDRTVHPRDAVKVGEKVRVKVLRIERGKDGRPRIALSIKAATPDPWADVATRFPKGARVHGVVARLADFGAFVQLSPGVDGLVHVSEIAPTRIQHPKEALSPGQEVDAIVRDCDPAKRRISLSIRDAVAGGTPARSPAVGDVVQGTVANIQPYGLFIDLPDYGPRVRGLAPREETGEPRGSDLAAVFARGSTLEVEVISVDGDRIRLRLPHRAKAAPRRRAETPREPARPEAPAPAADAPLTTMAIALRQAMERERAKRKG